jgi:hypothetical protein
MLQFIRSKKCADIKSLPSLGKVSAQLLPQRPDFQQKCPTNAPQLHGNGTIYTNPYHTISAENRQ